MSVLALVAGWVFHKTAIVPLRQRESGTLQSVAALKDQIADARRKIGEVQALEDQMSREHDQLASMQSDLPEGSAMIWLPQLVREHFGRSGIAVPMVRLNTTQNQPNIPGYDRAFWSVALAIDADGQNITNLLLAVADLDRQNSFVRVLDFDIRPDPENPAGRVASMNLTVLIRK